MKSNGGGSGNQVYYVLFSVPDHIMTCTLFETNTLRIIGKSSCILSLYFAYGQ